MLVATIWGFGWCPWAFAFDTLIPEMEENPRFARSPDSENRTSQQQPYIFDCLVLLDCRRVLLSHASLMGNMFRTPHINESIRA